MAKSKRGGQMLHGMSGGIFMIGLGVIFLFNIPFWPWILVLLGVTSVPSSIAEEGLWAGMQGFLWLVGLAIIFFTGQWALILVLIGLSTMLSAMVRPDALKKNKRKHDADYDDDYDYDDSPRRRAGVMVMGDDGEMIPLDEAIRREVDQHVPASSSKE
jgi:hypothetical protein